MDGGGTTTVLRNEGFLNRHKRLRNNPAPEFKILTKGYARCRASLTRIYKTIPIKPDKIFAYTPINWKYILSKVQTQSNNALNASLARSVNIQKAFPEITNTQQDKFKDFLSLQNIVLLGDPGAGKTHTFKEAAKHESAKFLPVRVFLATKGKDCKNKVIYLDGLDEFRSRMDDKNVIFEVTQLLSDIGCRGLRLSCRAQDWLGDSDLSLFEGYFGEEKYVVLNLESLREDEIITILKNKGIDNPNEFIRKATSLNISTLLHNPQTLVMLIDVVKQKGGEWPATKKDLYQKSTKLLLTEHNDERSRSGVGQYTPDELQSSAGIACACILISGVEGISLRNNGSNPTFPSYREITLCDSNLLLASLNRRVFSHSSDEVVTCVHRTVAEFLAASWLTDQVTNSNLPIKRVLSLIASEEHPTADLRGLYAWLATLLPDNYSYLFDNDPYGILMYGDSASLSSSSRQYLLASLEKLKEKDPWFRSSDWSDNPLGALAGKDMEPAFKRILTDSESGFHLRNIVLNAIIQGKPNRNLIPELQRVLVNNNYGYSDRSDAIEALLRIGKKGEECIVGCYHRKIVKEPKTIRLRINILRHLYREYFTPADAVQIIVDHANQNKGDVIRVYDLLYNYSNLFFISDIPEILNGVCLKIPDHSDYEKRWHNKSEIETCLFEMIEKVLKSPLNVTQKFCITG